MLRITSVKVANIHVVPFWFWYPTSELLNKEQCCIKYREHKQQKKKISLSRHCMVINTIHLSTTSYYAFRKLLFDGLR